MAAEKQQADESFETLLAKLEEIVSQLEAGERPLDESLTLYESGVAALKRCHSILDKSEKRIRLLLQDAQGNPALREAEIPENRKRESVSQNSAPAASPAPPAPDVQKKNKNSDKQPVDSEPINAQNPPSSPKLKSKTRPVSDSAGQGVPGEPDPSRTSGQGPGGSLFGSAS